MRAVQNSVLWGWEVVEICYVGGLGIKEVGYFDWGVVV